MADEGTGATLTFGTTGVTLDITSIASGGITREALETTNLGTTNAKTFIPGDLYDPGEITVQFQTNPDTQPPFTNASETVTITYPVPTGSNNGATEASSAFVTSVDVSTCEVDSIMMGSCTIKRTGAITFQDAS
jgi:hypothetical protein